MNKSRWSNDEEDEAFKAQHRREKEEKKRLKLERQRKLEEAQAEQAKTAENARNRGTSRPAKRRKLSPESEIPRDDNITKQIVPLLRFPGPTWSCCRNVDEFEKLNAIEEGSYGWVSRAKEKATGEIVALKKLKMDHDFPVTGLREIETLMACRHPHIMNIREVVMGDKLDDVFLVLDFYEHDLKTLQQEMPEAFLVSEVKTIMLQLASAVDYLHSNWILHRDLKTSNILMNNTGEIKVADFGMARYFSDPLPKLTQLVVTLWYRAPELLLGTETYGPEIDIWSLGCIFGELLTQQSIFQGKNEVDQLRQIFDLVGLPTEKSWPSFHRLPNASTLHIPVHPSRTSKIRSTFSFLTGSGVSLLSALLSLNPADRPTAAQVLQHPYFKEDPKPKAKEMFPTFPSKANQERKRRIQSPSAPKRGRAPKLEADFGGIFASQRREEGGTRWSLKLE